MNPISVPADAAKTLPIIDYKLHPDKALLVAFDFDPTFGSGNPACVTGVPATQATTHFSHQGALEAEKNDRETGYDPLDSIYLIERIDVA
jgi:hypothetical protein